MGTIKKRNVEVGKDGGKRRIGRSSLNSKESAVEAPLGAEVFPGK